MIQRIKCALGQHDWGILYVISTGAKISGERTEDGWDHEIDNNPDPKPYVEEYCKRDGCHGSRHRPDLDPTEVESGIDRDYWYE